MTFHFFLIKNKTTKNISLKLLDESLNINFTFRLPLYINEKDWDTEKQRPKNIYLKKYKKLNNKLDHIRISVKDYINRKTVRKSNITQRALSKEVQKNCLTEEPVYSKNCLLYLMQHYINSKKEFICKSTYKRYKVFFNLLQRFEGHIAERLYSKKIDMQVVKEFLNFGKKEEYSENTIYRTVHFIKTVLNFAEIRGIRTRVRELEIRREKQKKEIVTLNEQEILKIKHAQVPEDLQTAKDWLLISCYTGQRVSDFMKFSTDKITKIHDKECLSFMQQKTKKEMLLPLHPIVLKVILRNNYSFPPPMDIQKYNEDIKKIARISNIDQTVKARKRIGHRTRYMEIEKWQVITSHIGRRSFATNFYGKIPTALLMEATGHSSEQMFLRYVNPYK